MNTSSKMHVPHRNICYEVFGFDIVLDANLRTWLLEVNTGPALQSPAALDKRIKVCAFSCAPSAPPPWCVGHGVRTHNITLLANRRLCFCRSLNGVT
jgi:hypothetical protein